MANELMRKQRLRLGLSVVESAKAVGISRQSWTKIEAGTVIPNVKVAIRIAWLIGVDRVEDLFRSDSDAELDKMCYDAFKAKEGK